MLPERKGCKRVLPDISRKNCLCFLLHSSPLARHLAGLPPESSCRASDAKARLWGGNPRGLGAHTPRGIDSDMDCECSGSAVTPGRCSNTYIRAVRRDTTLIVGG